MKTLTTVLLLLTTAIFALTGQLAFHRAEGHIYLMDTNGGLDVHWEQLKCKGRRQASPLRHTLNMPQIFRAKPGSVMQRTALPLPLVA
jgi:hypothetical protein